MVKKKCIACIGNFNGVHIGHQKLIQETRRIASRKKTVSRLITFTPDPSQFYSSRKKHEKYLSDDETKKEYVEDLEMDEIQFIPFDKRMADTSAADFIETYLNGEVDTLVCGNDFTFGKDRQGTVGFLMEYPNRKFDVVVIDDVSFYGKKVSTTRIIETIRKGNMKLAGKMMNHPYLIKVCISENVLTTDFVLPPEGTMFIIDGIYKYKEDNGNYSIDFNGSVKNERAVVFYSF